MKQLGRYAIILVGVLSLWNSIVIKPLKLFTVILHELGHAIMAFIFGYGILDLNISLNEGGYTITQPKGWFSSFMIANGGYLGSVLFALLILYLKRTSFKKFILGTLAIIFLSISVKYSGPSLMLIYSIVFSAAVLILYMAQNDRVNDWVIDIIGIASVAYAIYDTFVDTILIQLNVRFNIIQGFTASQPVTDAVQLSRMTGIPAFLWGIIWLVLSLLAVRATLLKTGRTKAWKK